MRKIQLVGSVGLPDASEVFTLLADKIGPYVLRLPDGEVPPRDRWIRWQRDVFDRAPEFELDSGAGVLLGEEQVSWDQFRLSSSADIDSLTLGELGYAREAIKSWKIFNELQQQGVIPSYIRFQMSLPSAVAVCSVHITPDQQALIEPKYEQALSREIEAMLKEIPAVSLSIQWDICQEVLAIEDAWTVYYDNPMDGTIERLHRLAALVPEPCELGFHFCYGDPGHKHIKEPDNLCVCVELANGVCHNNPRDVNWIHMPIPKDRNDEAYYYALKDLQLQPDTELYLGLVHLTDGLEGAKRRAETASIYCPDFGIATECGFGRRPPKTIPALLKLHAQIAEYC